MRHNIQNEKNTIPSLRKVFLTLIREFSQIVE